MRLILKGFCLVYRSIPSARILIVIYHKISNHSLNEYHGHLRTGLLPADLTCGTEKENFGREMS